MEKDDTMTDHCYNEESRLRDIEIRGIREDWAEKKREQSEPERWN